MFDHWSSLLDPNLWWDFLTGGWRVMLPLAVLIVGIVLAVKGVLLLGSALTLVGIVLSVIGAISWWNHRTTDNLF